MTIRSIFPRTSMQKTGIALSLLALAAPLAAFARQTDASAEPASALTALLQPAETFSLSSDPADATAAFGQHPATSTTTLQNPPPSGFEGFIANYQSRVTATQARQPRWITPLVTVTPRLEQEFRTDFVHQYNPKGFAVWNYGNGKGLEFIPFSSVELLINVPPFFNRSNGESDGFGDMSFNSKFRFFARNEDHGNAIITGFFAASIPTGKNGNGSCCAVVTPTLAVGKGFGLLALTSTAGGSLPITNSKGLGHTITWNNAIQYHAAKTGHAHEFWPEVEFNSSIYKGGPDDGKIATFITPGMIIGRVPLTHDATGKPGRLGLTFGAGEQIALTHFHTYNHALVLTARLPF